MPAYGEAAAQPRTETASAVGNAPAAGCGRAVPHGVRRRSARSFAEARMTCPVVLAPAETGPRFWWSGVDVPRHSGSSKPIGRSERRRTERERPLRTSPHRTGAAALNGTSDRRTDAVARYAWTQSVVALEPTAAVAWAAGGDTPAADPALKRRREPQHSRVANNQRVHQTRVPTSTRIRSN